MALQLFHHFFGLLRNPFQVPDISLIQKYIERKQEIVVVGAPSGPVGTERKALGKNVRTAP